MIQIRDRERCASEIGVCENCEHAQVVTDRRGRVAVLCHYTSRTREVRVALTDCSCHLPANQMHYLDATAMGWILTPTKGGRAGFFSPPPPPKARDA